MLFALFNLGAQELIILVFGGLCFFGFAASVAVMVVLLTRWQNQVNGSPRLQKLEEENQRLREVLREATKDRAS